ncbi:MAG: hypothetical protein PCFJNLEI_02635 [Verrucomicrobiae bacterium]|nr:hypothetical protein [Verrucomicrobiae bacterium]
MRKVIVAMLCAVWVTGGGLMAQDAKDPQVEKIKTLRSGLLAKMPVLGDQFSYDYNGINTASLDFNKKYQAVAASLREKLETENAKTGEARDQMAINAVVAKQQRLAVILADRSASAAVQAWVQKFNDMNTIRLNLASLVTAQTANDQAWLRAGCDPAVFVSVLTELTKRVDELNDQITAHLNEWQKRNESDLVKLAE